MIWKKVTLITTLFLLLFWANSIEAINLNFQAMVDQQEISQDDNITVTIQVSGENLKESLPFPTVDESQDFKLVNKNQRQSSSQNISVINGRMTRSNINTTTFDFVFRPLRAGDLKLPGFSFEYQDFKRRIGATNIKVHKAETESGVGGDISLILKFARTSLYVNEQTALTAIIRRKADAPIGGVNQPDVEKALSKYFWIKPLGTNKWEGKRVDINGVMYEEFSQSYAVFPVMEGSITIPSIELKYSVIERRRGRRQNDPFDDAFFSSFFESTTTRDKTKYSAPVKMNIKPLPATNRPREFEGAVGDFKLSATVDKTELKAGEALNLKVTVTGRGNEKSIKSLTIRKKERFEIFDPEVTGSVDIKGNNVAITKSFRYVMIPQIEGEQELGPVIIHFFNPSKEAYDSSMSTISINVEKGKAGASPVRGATYVSKSDIRVMATDIRYIKTDGETISDMTGRFDKTLLFTLLVILPFAYTASFLFIRRHSIRIRTDAEYARNRKARKQAERLLADARKLVANETGFDDAVHRAIAGFVADKINLPSGSLTTTDIVAALEKKGLKEVSLPSETRAVLEECDLNRFTSIAATSQNREARLVKAAELIVKLSREL